MAKKKAKKKVTSKRQKKSEATKKLLSGQSLERRKRKKVLNSGEKMETKALPKYQEPVQLEFSDYYESLFHSDTEND